MFGDRLHAAFHVFFRLAAVLFRLPIRLVYDIVRLFSACGKNIFRFGMPVRTYLFHDTFHTHILHLSVFRRQTAAIQAITGTIAPVAIVIPPTSMMEMINPRIA